MASVAPTARGPEQTATGSRVTEPRAKEAPAPMEPRAKEAPVAMTDGANVRRSVFLIHQVLEFPLTPFTDGVALLPLHQLKAAGGSGATRETVLREEVTEAGGVAAMTLAVMTAAGGVLLVWGKFRCVAASTCHRVP